MSITIDAKLILLALAGAAFYLYLSWQSYMANFRRSILSETGSKQPIPDPVEVMKQQLLIEQVKELSAHHGKLVEQVSDMVGNHNKLLELFKDHATNHNKLVEQVKDITVSHRKLADLFRKETNELAERVNTHAGKLSALTNSLEGLKTRLAGAGEKWVAMTKEVVKGVGDGEAGRGCGGGGG